MQQVVFHKDVHWGHIAVFSIHKINDISDNLSSLCHLFADDCILYRVIKMFQFFKEAKIWTNFTSGQRLACGMQFNIDKCLVLRVTLKHDPCITEYFLQTKNLRLQLI